MQHMGGAVACGVAWWILGAQVLPGLALRRAEQLQGQGQWPAGFEPEAEEQKKPVFNDGMRSYAKFHSDFVGRKNAETFTVEPMTAPADYPGMRTLILGIWTRPYQTQYRETIRKTWMNQKKVCPLKAGPKDGCQVYTTFVIGTPGDGQPLSGVAKQLFDAAKNESDMTVLATTETNKHAKISDFFQRMALENSWATHIGKMDMDSYLYVPKLLTKLHEDRDCGTPYEVVGFPGHCNKTDASCDMADWLPKQCPAPEHEACHTLQDCPIHGKCKHYNNHFDYIRGHFMAVSRQLALRATDPEKSLMSTRLRLGAEEPDEYAISRSMLDAAWKEKSCIHFFKVNVVGHPTISPKVGFQFSTDVLLDSA
mmetsp:Transcript_18941/g.53423  ORF Transcript_18941/g.53423 Transcript_18941/m.53423 type:complete len:367 (-) Transcript_18941:92-1192(-)